MGDRAVTDAIDSDPISAKLASAMILYQQRRFADARAVCETVLVVDPKQHDAIHLLGVIAAHARAFERAVDLFSQAIAIKPDDPAPYANRGNALRALKQLEAAVASYDRAIQLKPDYAEAYSNRGNALSDLHQFDAALASYDRAIEIQPNHAGAHFNRGNVFGRLKDIDAAIASYDKAISIRPKYTRALLNRGVAHNELKQWKTAIKDFDRVIALQPDHAKAHSNKGVALLETKQIDAALTSFDHALRLDPSDDQNYFNRGNVFLAKGALEAAVASYDKAIELNPNHADAFINRGNALSGLGQHDMAMVSWDIATMIRPGYAEAYSNKAIAHLLTGDFERGWRLYEWRWRNSQLNLWPLDPAKPVWLGVESLQDKTILLLNEQGFGDTIQFIRYARLLADRGARVIVRVPVELMGVLAGVDGVSELIAFGSATPEHDFQCSLLSLPLACRTTLATIPCAKAYLKSDPARVTLWQARLGPQTKSRVGVVWRGRAGHVNDHNRSIPLASLVAFLPDTHDYFSLQKDVRDEDREVLAAHPQITHLGEELRDFSDTAALCELMDVVICVDTSVAHLSAALGRPTWILLPFVPDWRWLLNRDDSPWYPSVELYRQSDDRQWPAVLERVRKDLLALITT